jgi:uncharacterized protein (DUF1015 family)
VELRPFRSLRYAPRVIFDRGLAALLAPPVARLPPGEPVPGTAPENILRVTLPSEGEPGEAAAQRLASWLASGILMRERRPGLWLYRQTDLGAPERQVMSLLVGLVRLGTARPGAGLPHEPPDPRGAEKRLALRRALRADFEPCLLATRAPLSGTLATTRGPDLSAEDRAGLRHDAYRIHDYAQHVELQGLVKSAEVVLAAGRELWETARDFEKEAQAEAAKLPGAKYKLCAIVEEEHLRERRGAALAAVPLGLFGVSLEDPVY